MTLPNAPHRRTLSAIASTPEASSQQLSLRRPWAEDYYADSYEASRGIQNTFDHIPLRPPPATLTERQYPKSIPFVEGEAYFPRQPRQHQRSLTALLPFRSNTRTTSQSPQRSPVRSLQKESLDYEFMPTFTGDREESQTKFVDRAKGGISGWFSGYSAPVPVGLSVPPTDMPSPTSSIRSTSPERPPTKLSKQPTLPLVDANTSTPAKPATTSRFNFFSPKTPIKTVQLPADLNSDEFLTLDITAALFPSGPPSESDPFSPSAFKNLLQNAEGLLLKMQTAYKIRTLSLHELTSEKEIQKDQLEEAETRAMHLKLQLENMAKRVSEQDSAMEELVQQLAKEKLGRQEEKEASEKSIALIKQHAEEHSQVSGYEEDLGISKAGTAKTRWRNSNGSGDYSVGAESDDDAASGKSESVFSRSRSPTLMTRDSTPEISQAPFGRIAVLQKDAGRQPLTTHKGFQQPTSTFQRIMKGMGSSNDGSPTKEEMGGIGLGSGCSNCMGRDSSVAWDTVGLLKAENKGLKERVLCVEEAVEGALDLCTAQGFEMWLKRQEK